MPITTIAKAVKSAATFKISDDDQDLLRTGNNEICAPVLETIRGKFCQFKCDCRAVFTPCYEEKINAYSYRLLTDEEGIKWDCRGNCHLLEGHSKGSRKISSPNPEERVKREWDPMDILKEPQKGRGAKGGKDHSDPSEGGGEGGTRRRLLVSLLLDLLHSSKLNSWPEAFEEPIFDNGFKRLEEALRGRKALKTLDWSDLTIPFAKNPCTQPLQQVESVFRKPEVVAAFAAAGMKPKGLIIAVTNRIPKRGETEFRDLRGRKFRVDLSGATISGIGRTGPFLCILGIIGGEPAPTVTQVAIHSILNNVIFLPVESKAERRVAYHLRDRKLNFTKPVYPDADGFRPDFIVEEKNWIEVQAMDLEAYKLRKAKRLEEVDAHTKKAGLQLIRYDEAGSDNDFPRFTKDLEKHLPFSPHSSGR